MTGSRTLFLEGLAQAISDGLEVDWEAAEEAHPDLIGLLRYLRQLEHVAIAHGGFSDQPTKGPRRSVRS